MGGAHVLLIDGDDDNGYVWECVLKMERLSANRVTSPTEILHELKNHKYGVVILDADRVTVGCYVASIRLLRYMKVHVPPVILVSAVHPNQATSMAEKVGAVANFQKPARLCALLSIVHNTLQADNFGQ